MIENPKIAVLLATYNGSKYLAEQLDSILNQSYQNFLIVVRDDGSTDNTVAQLRDYADRHDEKIHLLEADDINRGASGSFSCLIEYVLANQQALGLDEAYMMFSDQDDVWFEDKIEKQLAVMLEAERMNPETGPVPVLVHCDLQVVSEQNVSISESFVRYQGLEITRNRFPNLLVSNLVTGCTAFINESLARQSVPVAKQAVMHDWWLALVATAFGRLIYLEMPLVYYRQHENNTIGAREYIKSVPLRRTFWQKVFDPNPNQHLIDIARQARIFRQQFGKQLTIRNNLCLRLTACMSFRVALLQKILFRIARRL